jgi:hypothetical protein
MMGKNVKRILKKLKVEWLEEYFLTVINKIKKKKFFTPSPTIYLLFGNFYFFL